MRKLWLILLSLMLLTTLLFVGCGDDDDDPATPTTSVTPATFTNGETYIYDGDGLYFSIYAFVHGGATTNVDSVKIGTASALPISSDYWNYADPYWECEWSEDADPSAYESGDNITISMYGDGKSSSCDITLLDYYGDQAEIISPVNNSTAEIGDTVEAVWAAVDNAEYYAIHIERRWDSSGTTVWAYDYANTRDTTYTLPEHLTESTVDYFYFYVMPVCGPDPTSYTGNWTGSLTTGVLYSHAADDNVLVYIGPVPRKDNSGRGSGR